MPFLAERFQRGPRLLYLIYVCAVQRLAGLYRPNQGRASLPASAVPALAVISGENLLLP
jgi:hypothetical protein